MYPRRVPTWGTKTWIQMYFLNRKKEEVGEQRSLDMLTSCQTTTVEAPKQSGMLWKFLTIYTLNSYSMMRININSEEAFR